MKPHLISELNRTLTAGALQLLLLTRFAMLVLLAPIFFLLNFCYSCDYLRTTNKDWLPLSSPIYLTPFVVITSICYNKEAIIVK